MTTPPQQAAGSILQAVRARTTLVRTVRTRLKSSGLDIRELANELVISVPGHPEQGRIYITYSGGEVSLRRCTWQYLGYLDGYAGNDPDAEPCLTTDNIIGALTEQHDQLP